MYISYCGNYFILEAFDIKHKNVSIRISMQNDKIKVLLKNKKTSISRNFVFTYIKVVLPLLKNTDHDSFIKITSDKNNWNLV